MTLQSVGQMFWPPTQMAGGPISNVMASSSITFDSGTDRLAWVGRSPLTDSLDNIYFSTRTVTGGCDVDVRVETVANGRPTGTLWAANTNIVVTIANGDDNVAKTATLTAAASLSAGDEFAVVIVVSSGTPNLGFASTPGALVSPTSAHYPLALQDTGAGTWATVSPCPSLAWILDFTTAGIVPISGLLPTTGIGVITAYNSGTAPDERALRFQVPFKCRVRGIRAGMFNIAAAADFTFSLWDAAGDVDGEALGQAALDGDFALSTTQDGYVDLFFDAPVTLTINTTYYAGVRADTANNIGLGEFPAAAITGSMLGFDGVNAETYLATRTWTAGTAGAWSTTTTTLPLIHLLIDQLDDGASAGGLGAKRIGGNLIG